MGLYCFGLGGRKGTISGYKIYICIYACNIQKYKCKIWITII